jgi:hypothetical protein
MGNHHRLSRSLPGKRRSRSVVGREYGRPRQVGGSSHSRNDSSQSQPFHGDLRTCSGRLLPRVQFGEDAIQGSASQANRCALSLSSRQSQRFPPQSLRSCPGRGRAARKTVKRAERSEVQDERSRAARRSSIFGPLRFGPLSTDRFPTSVVMRSTSRGKSG